MCEETVIEDSNMLFEISTFITENCNDGEIIKKMIRNDTRKICSKKDCEDLGCTKKRGLVHSKCQCLKNYP